MALEKTLYYCQPLSQEEQALLLTLRPTIHRRVIAGGLSAQDLRRLLRLQPHPQLLASVLDILFEEAAGFTSLSGGFDLRWD